MGVGSMLQINRGAKAGLSARKNSTGQESPNFDLFGFDTPSAPIKLTPPKTVATVPAPAIIVPSGKRQTEEQQIIIDAPLDGTTRVIAYAGTGKTSTLIEFAKRHPGKRGLYIAFNKAIQEEGARRFPKSVQCKTSHALAYRAFGYKYKHKMAGDLRLTDVINLLGLSYDYDFALLVKNTVLGFCTSDLATFPETAIAPDHTPKGLPSKLAYAAQQAYKLWLMMTDPNTAAPMIHDGYLKLFQLSGQAIDCDYILFDEAQDANPVTTALVKAQKCPVILVGDKYQSIYAFRGADNALESFAANRTFYLTQSFRFGSQVAAVASELLRVFYNEQRTVIGKGFDTQLGRLGYELPYAALCRTNSEVFDRAAIAIRQNHTTAFVGGVKSYNFDKIEDAYRLSNDESYLVRDQFLKSMGNFSALEQYAEDSGDLEAKRLVKVVLAHGHAIPGLVQSIYNNSIPDINQAERVFSTAHKAKGLDIARVVMAEDFRDLIENGQPIKDKKILDPQEVNLTYVSVTRAVEHLQLNSAVSTLMDYCEF